MRGVQPFDLELRIATLALFARAAQRRARVPLLAVSGCYPGVTQAKIARRTNYEYTLFY
jgi:hypothetical protein